MAAVGSEALTSDIKSDLVFVETADNTLELAWRVNVETVVPWYDVVVSASSGSLLAVEDWVDYETYNVLPLGVNDPFDGDRAVVSDPWRDSTGSRLGWHDIGSASFTDTRGNNAYTQENLDGSSQWEDNMRADGGSDLVFDFDLDLSLYPEEYINASITNLHYWNSITHDIFYEYGFDEVSGNFQEDNFGLGGEEVDAVQANAQDGAGFNNANFATPPDGQRGRMRMYVWNRHTPWRDGDFDNGIIIHEYLHGVSNRLTGGPANVGCLGGGQPGGLGEGWSDFYPTILRVREGEHDKDTIFEMGDYAAGDGIRLYPYSTNMTVNPQTFEYINRPEYGGVHAKGTYFATVLWDLFWDHVDEYGIEFDWYNSAGSAGNQVFFQTVVDGMKLQPCRPNMVEARDAILLADEVNNNGANFCLLWKGFARRGLGLGANGNEPVTEDFSVPFRCRF